MSTHLEARTLAACAAAVQRKPQAEPNIFAKRQKTKPLQANQTRPELKTKRQTAKKVDCETKPACRQAGVALEGNQRKAPEGGDKRYIVYFEVGDSLAIGWEGVWYFFYAGVSAMA